MNKIINSLATAEYDQKLHAVEVNFTGAGTVAYYRDTMDIAMNISLVFQTNQWLLKKDHFQDISTDAFLAFIGTWAEKACQLYREHSANDVCKIALYTNVETNVYLHSEHEGIAKHTSLSNGLTMKIFSDLIEARSFLGQGREPKVFM